MRRNKEGEWSPSIRKIRNKHYIDMDELIDFFDVRAEMRSQELDEWVSKHELDEPGVVEVAAEIDGSMEELDYLIKVLTYFKASHDINKIKTVEDLENLLKKLPEKS